MVSRSRLRILILAPRDPFPPRDGYSHAIAGPVSKLAERGHQVEVASFEDTSKPSRTARLQRFRTHLLPMPGRNPGRKVRALLSFSLDPYPVVLSSSAEMRSLLAGLQARQRFDLFQIEHLSMAGYLDALGSSGTPVVLRAQNVESELFRAFSRRAGMVRQVHYWVQALKYRRFERDVLGRFDLCIAPTREDAARFVKLCPSARVTTIPFGFAPPSLPLVSEEKGMVLFTGRMDYPPNIDAVKWFHLEVWPLIKKARPEARFFAVGMGLSEKLRQLGDGKGFVFTGQVEDVRPWFQRAQVFVAPIRIGSGMRIKILEAMAIGKAIVTTNLGAEGLGLRDGKEALLRDDSEGFAEAVACLLGAPALRDALGASAMIRLRQEFSLDLTTSRLEVAYQELVSKNKGAGLP